MTTLLGREERGNTLSKRCNARFVERRGAGRVLLSDTLHRAEKDFDVLPREAEGLAVEGERGDGNRREQANISPVARFGDDEVVVVDSHPRAGFDRCPLLARQRGLNGLGGRHALLPPLAILPREVRRGQNQNQREPRHDTENLLGGCHGAEANTPRKAAQ